MFKGAELRVRNSETENMKLDNFRTLGWMKNGSDVQYFTHFIQLQSHSCEEGSKPPTVNHTPTSFENTTMGFALVVNFAGKQIVQMKLLNLKLS